MFLPVLAARKFTAKLVVHRFTLNYTMHVLLQKENIITEEKLKILFQKKEHKNYLYSTTPRWSLLMVCYISLSFTSMQTSFILF